MNRHRNRQSKTPPHGNDAHLLGTMWLVNPALLLLSCLALFTIPAARRRSRTSSTSSPTTSVTATSAATTRSRKSPRRISTGWRARGCGSPTRTRRRASARPRAMRCSRGAMRGVRRCKRGVLGPWGAPIIAADRLTVPALLRQHGYATASDWQMASRAELRDERRQARRARRRTG